MLDFFVLGIEQDYSSEPSKRCWPEQHKLQDNRGPHVSGCEDWEERQVQIGYLSGKKDSNFNAVGRGICDSLDIPASVFKGVSKKGMVQVH